MMIARRADTRARADFATWKMIAKLNGASGLPPAAQEFLASYKTRLTDMTEHDATEATIREMYKAYYAEMGGGGAPPEVKPVKAEPVTGNVTAFRKLPPKPKAAQGGTTAPRKLPVALIFAALCVVYVGIRLYLQ
ncbi:hypothetical protein [Bradyrhizobium sp. ORS 285]|uniref:hypothetical protein n=1 Tax=Bradyrhizobium sp. ORS 285 TaxID=115808 RepID=UPI0002407266|nr:hypothetical protein [Bradyrhizobium sp. ORS 285]CCD83765.1 conserved hypothetical protein [Bradyrhizobium sp. ORS 285]